MRYLVICTVLGVFFTACSSPSFEEIKLECKKQGKVFKIKKKLVLRTGEYESVGYCD
jgi:hypothetical protein